MAMLERIRLLLNLFNWDSSPFYTGRVKHREQILPGVHEPPVRLTAAIHRDGPISTGNGSVGGRRVVEEGQRHRDRSGSAGRPNSDYKLISNSPG